MQEKPSNSAQMGPAASATPYDPLKSPVHELRLSKDAEEWLRTISPGMFENYQQIQGTWNHPFTQFSITLVRDSEFRGAVSEMYSKNASQALLGYEACWIILVWILRAWRLQKSPTLLTRLGTQAWIAVVFWVGSLLLVPTLVWGSAYQVAVRHFLKAFFRHFLA